MSGSRNTRHISRADAPYSGIAVRPSTMRTTPIRESSGSAWQSTAYLPV
ncbi:MAG: hypothetical protein O3A02_04155 [bacterium]|nr:hypothetical protein [bacterium]